jgi:hypothetical protein
MYLSTLTQLAYYVDPSSSDWTTDDSMSASPALMATFMIITLVIVAIAYVVYALLLGRIFKKASIESWKAWVPFYNNWILLEMGDQKGFWAVLSVIPIVNIVSAVFTYIAMYNIGLKFKKDGAFVLWAVFIPIVWYVWLAVDNSTWNAPAKKDAPTTPEVVA